ncbi:hypothetical protein C0V97_17180, partial [Asaia sp. W19]
GTYDPTAHATMPSVTAPSGYLPDTLNDVYIYVLNADGTVSASNDNAAIGPLTASYDGKTWKYIDANGQVVVSAQNTTTGVYQTENGFISYSPSGGYILVSNDKVGDPSQVRWSNQNGAVPGTMPFPSFGGSSTSLRLENLAGNESASYERIAGGVTSPGPYDPNTHANMPCFLAGSMILTEKGYRAVETLCVEDRIGVFNGSTLEWHPIKALSVGFCRVSSNEFPDMAGYPVVIRKDALGDNQPFADLWVTGDHAIQLDGKIVMARSLVDGKKISFDMSIISYKYYHIDLHDHHVIDANGLPVESLVSKSACSVFRNMIVTHNEFFPYMGPARQMALCTEPKEIMGIRNRYGLDTSSTTHTEFAPLAFEVFTSDGQQLMKRSTNGRTTSFKVPSHIDTLKLVSRVARPYDMIGVHIEDRRKLGLLVGNITMYEASSSSSQTSHLENEYVHGWSSYETDMCRWTVGEAYLKLHRTEPMREAVIAIEVLDDCERLVELRREHSLH